MAKEIERKFLVTDSGFKTDSTDYWIKQGYLNTDPDRTVRVRVAGDNAWLTIKSRNKGITRDEFEYPIDVNEAESLLVLCQPGVIEKRRYETLFANKLWIIDEFYGENKGLLVAEIELTHESEDFDKPEWLGAEVSDDPKYFNSALIKHPFIHW